MKILTNFFTLQNTILHNRSVKYILKVRETNAHAHPMYNHCPRRMYLTHPNPVLDVCFVFLPNFRRKTCGRCGTWHSWHWEPWCSPYSHRQGRRRRRLPRWHYWLTSILHSDIQEARNGHPRTSKRLLSS